MATITALAMLMTVAAIDPEPPSPALLPQAPPVEVEETEAAEAAPLTPREYLYAVHPTIAKRMDCVISRESHWTPTAVNPRSKASGLAQFLPSTWRTTPQAAAGWSVFEPYANIDAAAWLARTVGWRQWQVVTFGWC